MAKVGAVAILAMAALASASAQNTVECAELYQQCHGSDDSEKMACCEGQCYLKDDFYGQCRRETDSVPEDFRGTVVDYSNGITVLDTLGVNADDDTDLDTTKTDPTDLLDANDTDGDTDGDNDGDGDGDAVGGSEAAAEGEDEMDEDEVDEDEMDDTSATGSGAGTGTTTTATTTTITATTTTSTGDEIYAVFKGFDYLPSSITGIPKSVSVADVTPVTNAGHIVTDQAECEDMCSTMPNCNAASYYLDASAFGDKNCWLKIIDHSCVAPDDADVDTNAVLLLLNGDTCAEAPVPAAAAPDAATTDETTATALTGTGTTGTSTAVDTTDTTDTSTSTGTTTTTSTPTPVDITASPAVLGAFTYKGAMVAMAVAGVAGLL